MKPARSITIISRRTDGLIFPLPFPRVFDIMAKVFQYFTNGEIPMKKKALLAMLLVMTLLLSSCALIKKDAAVDAATVILKLGDKEYTKAQVQTYVDDVLYQMYQSTYNTYGTELDITNASVIASAQETAIKNLKQDMTIRAKAAELGLDQLTEEDLAEAKKNADDSYEYAKTYVKLYMLSEDERNLEGEELDAAVQKGLDALGVSYESYEKAARDTLVDKKVKEYAVKDVTVSEDEIKAEYDAKVAADEEKYKENPSSWVSASNSTSATTLYYTPAGIRRVKQILLKYKADDQTAIDEAQSKATTPASTAPAPTWQRLPTVARPPSTAPMSIMVSAPITAPMLMIAPIMMTARSPISTRSRMMAPGSMRAPMPFRSRSGTALLRRSFSITQSTMASEFAFSAGSMSAHSPNTIRSFSPNTLQFGNSTGPFALI